MMELWDTVHFISIATVDDLSNGPPVEYQILGPVVECKPIHINLDLRLGLEGHEPASMPMTIYSSIGIMFWARSSN
jgi:hypothetical protein